MRTFMLWFCGLFAAFDAVSAVLYASNGQYGWALYEAFFAVVMVAFYVYWLGWDY